MTPRTTRGKAARRLGLRGEALAARWYQRRGFRIVDRNWRCREGELDLVVERHGVVVFCEVKARSSTRFGVPAEAVSIAKQQRIRRLALAWLAETDLHPAVIRFDVASVLDGAVSVIEEAF